MEKLTDEEKEHLILARMNERGIKELCFFGCPACGHIVAYLGNDSNFIYGGCLLCGLRVLLPREGKPIVRRGEGGGRWKG